MLYLTAGIALLFALTLFAIGMIFTKAVEKKQAEEDFEKS